MKPLFAACFVLVFSLGVLPSFAQKWLELHWAGADFKEVKAAFEEEFGHLEGQRGRGVKQFRRLEWFWEPRVGTAGRMPEGIHYFNTLQKERAAAERFAADRSSNWQLLGYGEWLTSSYNPGNGRINCAAVDPSNPDRLYVGTPGGGMWKSVDGGLNWQPMTDQLATLGVSAIVVHPTNPNTIYIATGDGDASDTYGIGVLRSQDGGLAWNTTGLSWDLSENARSFDMLFHPTNANILFAATSKGLFKSVDAGENWTMVLGGIIRDFEFKPGQPDVIYAVNQTRFFKSTNTGETFSEVSTGLPAASGNSRIAMSVTPANPDYVYLLHGLSSNQGFRGLYRSVDSGQSFEERATEPNILGWSMEGEGTGGQAWYDLAIAASPTNAEIIFTGGVNVWKSTNGGEDFEIVAHWYYYNDMPTPYVHADIHSLRFFGNRLYCTTDGGVFVSEDMGQSFNDLSAGLVINQFYKVGTSPNTNGQILGGLQDNGTVLYKNGAWKHVLGADGMECDIHPTNPNTLYAAIQYGGIRRSTNGGQDWTNIVPDFPEGGAWVTPFTISPSNPNFVYAGFKNVWRSANQGDLWTKISDFDGGSTLRSLEVNASNPNIILAATTGLLHRTTNGGSTWSQIGQWTETITSVKTHPLDGNRIWVTVSGFSAGNKVFYSANGGQNWQNISGNLPNLPANTIAVDHTAGNGLYVGTDIGVYFKNDQLTNWIPFFNGLPNVVVSELEIIPSANKIYAASYGRGIWFTDVFQMNDANLTADFSAHPRHACVGEPVVFTDQSLYSTGRYWTFEGGQPANSGEAQPTVTYSQPGTYAVALLSANESNQMTEIKSDYIVIHPSPGVAAPYSQGFEAVSLPSELPWLYEPDVTVTPWKINADIGAESVRSFWVQNHDLDVPDIYEFVSEPIDLSGYNGGSLTFDVAYAQRTTSNDDRLKIYFSNDCGATWSLRRTLRGTTNLPTAPVQTAPFFPAPDQWENESVSLVNSYYVPGFRFKLSFENDNGNNIFIDNININGIVGIAENEVSSLAVYPNPASEFVQVEWQGGDGPDRWQVLDLTGRKILEGSLSGGFEKIDLTAIPEGAYLLRLSRNGWPYHSQTIVIQQP